MSIARTINVELGDRSYPIVIGSGLLGGGFDLSAHVVGGDCLVVTNKTVAPLYLEQLTANLAGKAVETIEIPEGEEYKTISTVETIVDRLVDSRFGRDATVIALGGGVVGDIAGFAAASYMRGIGFIQVPTTLLAQVDSSVGGKTGVNHPKGKNLIGAFYQPNAVLIDVATLTTLSDRELKAGLAEVIKYGAIVDADFFAWLEDNIEALLERNKEALTYAIEQSCELKARVVAEDERESGRRAILNFGHTFGHAIEHCLGYGEWLHGEAVAAGMLMAARLSDHDGFVRLRALIERSGLPLEPPEIELKQFMAAMSIDKKVSNRALRLVLLEAIGSAYVDTSFQWEDIDEILRPAD